MARVNEHYLQLPGSYLFSALSERIARWEAEHPGQRAVRLSIGDVTLPLPETAVRAMKTAAEEMGTPDGVHGYGPEQGYLFLREAIAAWDYKARGIEIAADEIFVSDGAKSDCGNIGEIFARDTRVAVCDPVYPVYTDSSAMAGRAGTYDRERGIWTGLCYLPCVEENGFLPRVPEETVDLIYLCFPNNPTGAATGRAELKRWVDYANERGAVILYDGAYEAFISQPDIPHSIYEVEGARQCAIEVRSFSKTAGFTGARCAYTVIPKQLEREGKPLHSLWSRRQATKFNGVSYVVQRGARALYTSDGQRQIRDRIEFYRENARIVRKGLIRAGLQVYGGVNAPYLWVKTPEGESSWSFFERLLEQAGVAVTPGAGFGPHGEGFVRLTAFGDRKSTREAVERIAAVL